jgi:CPA2 family monovalent cation:H+ antiporter-2
VNALDISLIYLLAAVAGVVLCRLAKLPPMLGHLSESLLLTGT